MNDDNRNIKVWIGDILVLGLFLFILLSVNASTSNYESNSVSFKQSVSIETNHILKPQDTYFEAFPSEENTSSDLSITFIQADLKAQFENLECKLSLKNSRNDFDNIKLRLIRINTPILIDFDDKENELFV